MAALYRTCIPIYLLLLTLGIGFTSANLMNLQGSGCRFVVGSRLSDSSEGAGIGSSSSGEGVGNPNAGVVVAVPVPVPGGITVPGVFPGIQIPGISIGVPGVSVGIPGISVGIPGISVGIPGVNVQTPGISVGVPGVSVGVPGVSVGVGGQSGVVYVPCPVYVPGYGCVYAVSAPLQATKKDLTHHVGGETDKQRLGN